MGDGEQAEGSVWEAAMAGSHYKLDNLFGIVDRNHLQISGNTGRCDGPWKTLQINGVPSDGMSMKLMGTIFRRS